MKTAMNMIMNFDFGPDTDVDIEKLMKAYGKQCAEQALKDASIRLNETSDNEYGLSLDDYHTIMNTPILTP